MSILNVNNRLIKIDKLFKIQVIQLTQNTNGLQNIAHNETHDSFDEMQANTENIAKEEIL